MRGWHEPILRTVHHPADDPFGFGPLPGDAVGIRQNCRVKGVLGRSFEETTQRRDRVAGLPFGEPDRAEQPEAGRERGRDFERLLGKRRGGGDPARLAFIKNRPPRTAITSAAAAAS